MTTLTWEKEDSEACKRFLDDLKHGRVKTVEITRENMREVLGRK